MDDMDMDLSEPNMVLKGLTVKIWKSFMIIYHFASGFGSCNSNTSTVLGGASCGKRLRVRRAKG